MQETAVKYCGFFMQLKPLNRALLCKAAALRHTELNLMQSCGKFL
ncbi:hypothetical protein AEST_16070 [Alishewanella aestuarii B11]|uniref:Uncharacterized protein n=1 Tax=Alishewanella aestuarii B11 TaxID=1197174 RepID=J1QJE7_9ALTE|nr:hypothetical protein AEST_16070 [Alishewanella aestuarii B11]